MSHYHIAVIAGDGIGPEVIGEGKRVLKQAALAFGFTLEFEEFPWGCDYYRRTRRMMPQDALDTLDDFDAIYLGAVGRPDVPDHVSLRGLLLPIRQGFDQYINLRPVRLLGAVPCPIGGIDKADVDLIIVRENTEGEYSGVGGRVHRGSAHEIAVQSSIFSRHGVERISRYAFCLAKERKGRITSVTKSNAMQHGMVLWDETVEDIAGEFPEVELRSLLVDAAAARLITHPEEFDVIVASNLFADILSELGAVLQGGSLGLAASANIEPTKKHPSMFEPVHGSAPDISGQGIANPTAAIWSGALMLEFLGEPATAKRVVQALDSVLSQPQLWTRDLGGSCSTPEFGGTVVSALTGANPINEEV